MEKPMALSWFLRDLSGALFNHSAQNRTSATRVRCVKDRSNNGDSMQDRAARVLMLVIAVLLAILVLQPYVNTYLFSAREPRPVSARGDLSDLERSTIQVFETVAPSVVQVVSLSGRGSAAQPAGTGTGFVWDAAGHVVTNEHVVQNATSYVVRLASGEVLPARVVGQAPNYDLAVLQLERRTGLPPPVAVGRSADLKVGQTAYAIGNPFGLDQSLTTGIISALKRRLPTSGGREIADVIQTDAAINPGNSGGPLLDSAGRLIGVNTAIYSPSGTNAGIGFSIPVDVVNRVVPELIRTGRVPTPGIGILAADETIAAQLGVTGVIVGDVVPGSPAEQAGLRGVNTRAGLIGDVIVGAQNEPVQRLSDLTDKLERAGVGSTVSLTILRDNRTQQIDVRVVDVGTSARKP
jgi:2-alkenal reductase